MVEEQWVDRHAPESFSELQGQNKSAKQIKRWAKNWSVGDNAILLHGPPGTGKTTTARLVADMLDAPMTQINASEARKSDDIEKLATQVDSSGMDSDYQVVFLDEIDSMHHSVNLNPLAEKIKNPRNPIILACNDKYEVPGSLKNGHYVDSYKFSLSKASIKSKVKKIAKKEGVDLSQDEIQKLSERPDLRSAINDLQLLAEGDGYIGDDEREWSGNKWELMTDYLMGDGEALDAMTSGTESDVDPMSAVHWIDQNLPEGDYRGLEAGMAYDCLSRADRQLGRAGNGDYRSWKFAMELMEQIPDLRLGDPPKKRYWVDVSFPEYFKKKKPTNQYPGEWELFQELKDMEYGSYCFSGNFTEFRKVLLPILKDTDEEERYEMCLNHGLSEKATEALGIDPDDLESWVEREEPEAGEWEPPTDDAMDW